MIGSKYFFSDKAKMSAFLVDKTEGLALNTLSKFVALNTFFVVKPK